MTDVQFEIANGYSQIEDLIGNVITWNGNDYPCIASITDFRRELVEGGYRIDRLLNASIRLLNPDGSSVFTVLPQPQQTVKHRGVNYRLEIVKEDQTATYLHITAMGTTKGF